MNDIQVKISKKTINYYIEANLDDFYIQSSEHSNFIFQLEDKISWVISKNGDWPNCIFRANYENTDVKKEIFKIKELIQKKRAPNGWTVGPLSKPKNLGKLLKNCGFSNIYHQAGMAVELNTIENKDRNERGLIIELVNTEESLHQWLQVVSKVFNLKIDLEFLNFLLQKEKVFFYLGKFGGIPVSTLMLYLSSGVAGLHAVSTLEEYRNKGFGLIISRKALTDALYQGYYVGVLQASSLGESVYRKLGFQKYCDIVSYALEN